METITEKLENLLGRLQKVKKTGDKYMACCPAHDDADPSLSINIGKDKKGNPAIGLNCFSGCSKDSILAALEIDMSDLFQDGGKVERRIVAEYNYTDEAGKMLYQKVRYEPRDFLCRVPDGSGWKYKLNGCRKVLYNLPDVIKSDTVHIAEGEKDCNTLKQLGYVSTCNFDGASKDTAKPKWLSDYNKFFAGKTVYIIPDNDAPGIAHAENIHRNIKAIAASVKIVKLPSKFKDTTEFFQNGGNKELFDGLCRDAPDTLTVNTEKLLPLIRLSDVMPEPISWLWDNKFVNHGLNLIAGMGEAGKTTFSAYLMGRITTGQDWIDCKNNTPAGTCLFFGNEDALENSIRPKLDAAGADPSKVVALNYDTFFNQGENFNLVEHIEYLDNTIKNLGDVRAVFFDPLNGYVGKVNANNDCEARSVLIPLQNIAKKYGITIFGLCHLNKKSDLVAIDRVMGSVAFVNTARAVWFITHDKPKGLRYLQAEKANYCINPENKTFKIIDNAVAFLDGTTQTTADDVLQAGRQKSDSTVECTEWLQKKLQYNSALATDIKEQAEIEGFSRYALDEAKRSLRVVSKRDGFGGNGKWRLSLPEQGGKDA